MNAKPHDSIPRILVIDDNRAIHDDFHKILQPAGDSASSLDLVEAALFGHDLPPEPGVNLEIDSAFQGQEGLARVRHARAEGRPYALAFVDIRMPPGWDGIETIGHLWKEDPALQIVVCTAYSDYSWEEVMRKLGRTDRLLILKKPFDTVEVLQLACALTEKWSLARKLDSHLNSLQGLVQERMAELENSLSLTQATLEATADGILVVSQGGRVACFNNRFLDMWGIPLSLLESREDRRVWEFVQEQLKDPQAFLAKVNVLCAEGEAANYDVVEFKDGKLFELYSLPHRVAGKSVGRVWSFRDITERRQLEEQLRQAQKMEVVGQLAGGVAHDFNNMLTVIRGYSELLLARNNLDAESSESLKEIHAAGERAFRLTRQLLTFSRRDMMQPRNVDLNDLLENLVKMLRRMIREDIRLECRHALPAALIHADAGMIEQLIMNLAVNARDAMPKGGHLIIETSTRTISDDYVARQPEAKTGEFICLCLSDSGTGISPEILPRIFEPFFTTKEVGRGTGLGLATVYGIVKQHGGWIEVSTRVGQGTTFSVFLPPPRSVAPEGPTELLAGSAAGGRETILLVEDEKAVRRLAARVLTQHGYRVIAAASGPEAVELWNTHAWDVDLLLTDMIMPGGLSGRELAQRLRAEKPHLKVIINTGYDPEILPAPNGPPRYQASILQKPFTSAALLNAVRQTLDTGTEIAPVANR